MLEVLPDPIIISKDNVVVYQNVAATQEVGHPPDIMDKRVVNEETKEESTLKEAIAKLEESQNETL